jgi:hypothetical protein
MSDRRERRSGANLRERSLTKNDVRQNITSLASAGKFWGISRPNAFAVLRLMTRSITLDLRDTSWLLNSARLDSLF